jgi:hypothetical protein
LMTGFVTSSSATRASSTTPPIRSPPPSYQLPTSTRAWRRHGGTAPALIECRAAMGWGAVHSRQVGLGSHQYDGPTHVWIALATTRRRRDRS